jgi:hypothetical protein
MLRTWIEDVIGRQRQLGFYDESLEEENRKLQAELTSLLKVRTRKRRNVRALAARQQVGTA